MKKSIILLSAAAVMFSAACQKEEINSGEGLVLSAEVEQQVSGADTKTYADRLTVKWSEGDKINVFTNASTPEKLTLSLTGGQGTTSGTFYTSESFGGEAAYAIYPADDNTSVNGSYISFTLPQTQVYAKNSFGLGSNVAVAKVTDSGLAFKNTCGVLKLQLKGSMMVKKIEVTTNSTENLWGNFIVNLNEDNIAIPSSGGVGGTSLILDCSGCEGGGVQLSTEVASDFYIVVPVGAFKQGFTAVLTDVADEQTTVDLKASISTSKNVVINRSKIRVMESKGASILNTLSNGYTEVKYIQSYDCDGASVAAKSSLPMQFIQTDYTPNDATEFCISFKFESESDYAYLYSGENGFSDKAFHLYTDNSSGRVSFGFGSEFSGELKTQLYISTIRGKICRLHIQKGECIKMYYGDDGSFSSDLKMPDDVSFTSDHPLALLRRNRGGEAATQETSPKTSLYYVKIWESSESSESSEMKRYMVPCSNSEGVRGMYDLIEGVFLPNSSTYCTTDFISGGEL